MHSVRTHLNVYCRVKVLSDLKLVKYDAFCSLNWPKAPTYTRRIFDWHTYKATNHINLFICRCFLMSLFIGFFYFLSFFFSFIIYLCIFIFSIIYFSFVHYLFICFSFFSFFLSLSVFFSLFFFLSFIHSLFPFVYLDNLFIYFYICTKDGCTCIASFGEVMCLQSECHWDRWECYWIAFSRYYRPLWLKHVCRFYLRSITSSMPFPRQHRQVLALYQNEKWLNINLMINLTKC